MRFRALRVVSSRIILAEGVLVEDGFCGLGVVVVAPLAKGRVFCVFLCARIDADVFCDFAVDVRRPMSADNARIFDRFRLREVEDGWMFAGFL